MKYSDLIIAGVPKSFDIWDSIEYLQPLQEGMNPDDILYDAYPAECDEGKGEDACVIFKYNDSSTGIEVVHTSSLQRLSVWLSPWAVEADVLLYASFVNAVLAKHKKARLYDGCVELQCLNDDVIEQMIFERKSYLKRLLTTKEGFTMEGLNAGFSLNVSHLKPATSLDMQVTELQRQFVQSQWEF